MKKILFTLSVMLSIVQMSFAQSAEEIFEQTWKGKSVIASDVSPGGQGQIYQELYDVDYKSNNQFTGKVKSTVNMNGTMYSTVYKVDGYVNESTYEVTIYCGSNVYEDKLPYDMYWYCETLYLTIYKDQDNPGHYIMNGKSAGMSKSFEYFELVTKY